ncbi:MAG: bifunctional hydroxymethylpyrimidine kinase/phosphomethylpyrimidine kinase [Peptoniphilus sp.]|nr:bifunctional hydroxymethylpyrimidine kinase/phosphomethylpyrimidine kinase [Peptoniphilus sp.]MDY3119069.1 bifunctional hydroxymethylpyrimidine kinase/phosphomethylpyrimidine kinase [Peptoniphilus sp.]
MMTVAGSDSSGGAGIQADIKTATALGVFATSAITALTAQNTTGVFAIDDVRGDVVAAQMRAILTDIPPDSVKIGMVSSQDIIATVGEELAGYEGPVVLDPVMVSTSGSTLLKEEAIETLKAVLFPRATLITPNIPEAELLTGIKIESTEDQKAAAKALYEAFGASVLLKGGHGTGRAADVFYDGAVHLFEKPMLKNPNTHGTGCTLSSAVASYLALGLDEVHAVEEAKNYVYEAIADGLDLGRGRGPINHMVRRKK